MCNNNINSNLCMKKQLCNNLGKIGTIYTAAGEFTGCIDGVNNELVRLVTKVGPPQNGPCDDICGMISQNAGACGGGCNKPKQKVCDIPIDKIEAFCRKV